MTRRLVSGSVLLLVALLVLAPAATAEGADDELAGYVGTASAAAFSLQPIFPGLLPTGDAPFEVTGALTVANVKSGGNAYGQSAAVWPGSAAANMGPLLSTAAGQPVFVQTVPAYPASVSANQDEGSRSVGAAPGPVLEAGGKSGSSHGTASATGAELPGVLHVDAVVSTSRAAVEGGSLVTESVVTLTGIALGDGAVTIDSLKSVARATSSGDTSTSSGSTVLSGLKVAGTPAELTADGLRSKGVPTGVLTQALKAAGMTLALNDGTGNHEGGTADRVSSGLLVTMDNPAASANPQFAGSRFVLTLGPTAVGALASPPYDASFDPGSDSGFDAGLPALADTGGFSDVATAVTEAYGPAGGRSAAPVAAGSPVTFEPARNVFDRVGGVPTGMLVALLAAALLGARWISRYAGRFLSTEE